MRVAMVSKALVVGSYRRKCELLAEFGDIALTVFVPPRWGDQALEPGPAKGYELRELPIRANGNFHLHHYPTLADELARGGFDLVHMDEEPYNLATFQVLRAAKRLGAKSVFFSWQNILRAYPPPFRNFERYAYANASVALAGSDDAKRVLEAKGCSCEIRVLPQFGVDEMAFVPRPISRERVDGDAFVVGFAGRWVREKGADLLLRALAPMSRASAIVAGGGPEAATLRRLAGSLGIADRVEFVGTVPSREMPAFYQRLDALAVPSRTLPNWKEQFGRVIVEAMACGVPVVGAGSGAIPELVGDAGLTFAEGDAGALERQLRALQSQPSLRDELARRGRARVVARYTMRSIAAQTADVYRCAASG